MADVLSEAIVSIKSTFDNSGMKEANSALTNFTNKAKQLGGLLGGAFALHGITNLIEQSVKFGGALADTSQRLGISTDVLQEYGFVAEKAGISSETFAKGIAFLNANIGEAQKGNKQAVESFKSMGISLKGANGQFKTLQEILDEVPDGLNRLKTDSQKVAVAGKLFGKSGKQSALILAQGSKEIRAQITALRQYGGVLSKEAAGGLDEIDDRLLLVNKGWEVFKAELTFGFKDAILNAFSYVKTFTDGFKDLEKQFGILKPIVIGLGITIAAAMAPALLEAAPVVALFTALAFIIDDLIALFSGGKSVIGAVLADFLGYEEAKKVIFGVKEGFRALVKEVGDGSYAIKQSIEVMILPLEIMFDILKSTISVFTSLGKFGQGNFSGAFKDFTENFGFNSTFRGLSRLGQRKTERDFLPNLELKQFPISSGVTQEQVASSLSGGVGPTINNARSQSNNVSATFNIQSNDPHEVARIVNEQLGVQLGAAMASTTQEVD